MAPCKSRTKLSTVQNDRVETASTWLTATRRSFRQARSDVVLEPRPRHSSAPSLEEIFDLIAIGARELQLVPALQGEEVFTVHVRTKALHEAEIHDRRAMNPLE